MQAGSGVRTDGSQAVIHAITLIANATILIETGKHCDWNFAVSQKGSLDMYLS